MQGRNFLYCKTAFSIGKFADVLLDSGISPIASSIHLDRCLARSCVLSTRLLYINFISKSTGLNVVKNHKLQTAEVKGAAYSYQGELSDEDDDLCPVECVREFKTGEEFYRILEKAKETDSLVVVDFYRTSCGSCKYIEKGFAKLCRGSGDQEAPIIFLKHNVMDEYDEPSEFAEQLRVKAVPLFQFYKDGVLLEAFPTRDKEKIVAAILKYSSPAFRSS